MLPNPGTVRAMTHPVSEPRNFLTRLCHLYRPFLIAVVIGNSRLRLLQAKLARGGIESVYQDPCQTCRLGFHDTAALNHSSVQLTIRNQPLWLYESTAMR